MEQIAFSIETVIFYIASEEQHLRTPANGQELRPQMQRPNRKEPLEAAKKPRPIQFYSTVIASQLQVSCINRIGYKLKRVYKLLH